MKMNQDQLLVIASDTSVHTISKGLEAFPGLKMIRAYGDADVVELLVTHQFTGIFMEEGLPGISALKIAARLSNHENSEITPLVFITNTSTPLDLFTPFPSLLLDFIPTPIDPGLLRAKIKLLFTLHSTRNAVAQSIDELDHVHEQIMDLQKISREEQALQKEAANFSSAVAGQIQSPLKNIQAGIYQLQKTKGLPPQTEKSMNHIRNAVQQITGITQRMAARVNLAPKPLTHLTDDTGAERPCQILYVTGSKEEFDIFRQYLKEGLNCILYQAETIAQAKQIISAREMDLIFIDHLLSDGPGLDLLADLHRRKFDTPIIYTLNKAHVKIGAKAIVQGAHNFFIKEKLSTQNIQAILWETLERSRLTKQIKDARQRIVLMSIRDHLTRLYNRQYFDQTLNTEMDKARRYQFPLSILMVDFDKFKTLNLAHGYETGDQALRSSAALVKGMVRNLDMVCRYGGDEFGILLPNTGLEGAKLLARRILKGICSHGVEINGTPFPLTVSIGITSHTGTSPYQDQGQGQGQGQDLVKQALKAAAMASQKGGNTIQLLTTSVNPHA